MAKPESLDEKCPLLETNELFTINNDHIRPQIATSSTNHHVAQLNLRPNSSQNTSFIGQFMQSGGQNGGTLRHAISPICCEVSKLCCHQIIILFRIRLDHINQKGKLENTVHRYLLRVPYVEKIGRKHSEAASQGSSCVIYQSSWVLSKKGIIHMYIGCILQEMLSVHVDFLLYN